MYHCKRSYGSYRCAQRLVGWRSHHLGVDPQLTFQRDPAHAFRMAVVRDCRFFAQLPLNIQNVCIREISIRVV